MCSFLKITYSVAGGILLENVLAAFFIYDLPSNLVSDFCHVDLRIFKEITCSVSADFHGLRHPQRVERKEPTNRRR